MKKYRTKIALIAALALLLTAAIPALAATTTKITGKYEDPDIQVLIPTAGEAVINPFGLAVKVTLDRPDGVRRELDTGNQIATRPLVGVNLGGHDLQIGAKVTAEERGDFTFTSKTIDVANEKTKAGKVYFQLRKPTEIDATYRLEMDTSYDETTWEQSVTVDDTTICNGIKYTSDSAPTTTGVKAVLEGWQGSVLNAYTAPVAGAAGGDILIGSNKPQNDNMVTIQKADPTTHKPVCTSTTQDSYFVARLAGEVAKFPEEDWKPADGFNATVTWIIQPVG